MKNEVGNVAYYVLNKLNESITTLKLQKLVYYCQAWSLAWDGKPLFKEDFEGWANGPVCPKLFDMHRGRFVVNKNDFKDFQNNSFTDTEQETMDIVIKELGNKSPDWLSDLTHNERPWLESRTGLKRGQVGNNIISKEIMQEYYGSL